MAESDKRRILITGVSRFLGLRLAKRLEHDDRIDKLVGVDLDEPPLPIHGLEFVRTDIRNPLIARVLESTGVDTLIHTNIASSPARLGGRSQMKEINVIGTMQLLAAAQRSGVIKKVVMRSSSAVYGSSPGEPSLIPEDYTSAQAELTGYGRDCAEAETFARDFGRRRPDVDLVILRTQNVVGPTVRTSITQYLSLPAIPYAMGFDPRLQLLHEEDAIDALYDAAMNDYRGIFNIAADGVVYLSKAARMLGRPPLPLPLPAAQVTAGVLRRLGLVDFPTDQLKLILYGRALSTHRARETFGFTPRHTTEQSLVAFRDSRVSDYVVEPSGLPTWEKDLLEYLKRKSDREREMV